MRGKPQRRLAMMPAWRGFWKGCEKRVGPGVMRILRTLLAGLSVLMLPALAAAQDFPDRPIKLIVRFPAGDSETYFSHSLSGTASRSGQAIIPL